MKNILMGMATLIIIALSSCAAKTTSEDIIVDTNIQKEVVKSLALEHQLFEYDSAITVDEVEVDFSYIEDAIWINDSMFCVEYYDPDAFDCELLEENGYKFDNPVRPVLRCWVSMEDLEAFLSCYRSYSKVDYPVKQAINHDWELLVSSDGLYYQWVRRFEI